MQPPQFIRRAGQAILAAIVASSLCCPRFANGTSTNESPRPPSATEVFHLRSECAALGQRILDNNVIGPALNQSEVSHYEPKSNRCYVLLTVQTAHLAKAPYKSDDYLFDGQTNEMLASLHYEAGDHGKSGIVFDSQHTPTSDADGYYDDTQAYIESKMKDER